MTNDFKVLMQRFHDQTITPEERIEYCKLLESGLYNEYWGNELLVSLCTEPEAIVGKDEASLERAYRGAVKARPDAGIEPVEKSIAGIDNERPLKFWMAAAAVATLAFMATVWTLITDHEQQQEVALTVIQGPLRLELPDKSRVLLDEHTTLAYDAATYGKGIREVTLTGQAFFEVTPDPSAPFIVRSEKVTTRVLGTSFNVSSWPQKNNLVTVSEGKVEVKHGEDQRRNITPGQQIMVSAAGHTSVKRDVDADTVLAWKKKYLLFDKIPLAEAMRCIAEKFDVNVKFAEEDLKTIIIDAAFVAKEDMEIENVFKVVGTIANITFKTENGTVTVKRKE